jgi:hypothetical protein
MEFARHANGTRTLGQQGVRVAGRAIRYPSGPGWRIPARIRRGPVREERGVSDDVDGGPAAGPPSGCPGTSP